MLYYVYVIVIYDGMYLSNMVLRSTSNNHEILTNLYQQVEKVFGDGYKGSMKRNGTYDALGLLWGYS